MTTHKTNVPSGTVQGTGNYRSPEICGKTCPVESGFCNSKTSESVRLGKKYSDWSLDDSEE